PCQAQLTFSRHLTPPLPVHFVPPHVLFHLFLHVRPKCVCEELPAAVGTTGAATSPGASVSLTAPDSFGCSAEISSDPSASLRSSSCSSGSNSWRSSQPDRTRNDASPA